MTRTPYDPETDGAQMGVEGRMFYPDAIELSAVTPLEPGTVWAVDGGS